MSVERQLRTPEDIRKEGRRRLTIGIAGLAAMLLLVGLSSLLTSAVRREAEIAREQAEAAGLATASETGAPESHGGPLSELGVQRSVSDPARANGPAPTPATPPAQRGTGGSVVVPDLEPDPHLNSDNPNR